MYQEHKLKNGLRLLMVPVAGFQSVSVGIFVGVGSRYEDNFEGGAAHFIEHMLFKGTTYRPSARLIAEAIEGVGGLSNAYTDQETTVFYAKVAASQANTAINVLADLVRHPRHPGGRPQPGQRPPVHQLPVAPGSDRGDHELRRVCQSQPGVAGVARRGDPRRSEYLPSARGDGAAVWSQDPAARGRP